MRFEVVLATSMKIEVFSRFYLILLYIHIVTYATLDLSNYILQNYNTCTNSQNCDKHKIDIQIK